MIFLCPIPNNKWGWSGVIAFWIFMAVICLNGCNSLLDDYTIDPNWIAGSTTIEDQDTTTDTALQEDSDTTLQEDSDTGDVTPITLSDTYLPLQVGIYMADISGCNGAGGFQGVGTIIINDESYDVGTWMPFTFPEPGPFTITVTNITSFLEVICW